MIDYIVKFSQIIKLIIFAFLITTLNKKLLLNLFYQTYFRYYVQNISQYSLVVLISLFFVIIQFIHTNLKSISTYGFTFGIYNHRNLIILHNSSIYLNKKIRKDFNINEPTYFDSSCAAFLVIFFTNSSKALKWFSFCFEVNV